jgi:predicted MFS family arabinose efflux permease
MVTDSNLDQGGSPNDGLSPVNSREKARRMATVLERTGPRVGIIFGLGVMAAMTVSEAVTELSAIGREFHPANGSLIGLVMSLPSLVVALGALLAGYFVDRVGDRPVLLLGATTAVLGDMCVIAAPSLEMLLAGRLLTGGGYVLAAVGAITILMRITSGKQRTMALALWSTTVPVSFVLPFLSAGLAARLGTWRAAFAGHAALTALLVFLAILSLPKPEDRSLQPSRTAGLGAVLRTPWPYLLGLSFAANAFVLTGTIATLGPYLSHRYGVSELVVQQWNVVAMIANMFGCLLVGRLLNRGIPAQIIGFCGIVLSGAAAALIFGAQLGVARSIAMSWVFALGCGLLVGMWALVPRCAPSPSSMGATSGLVTQLTLIGVLLGAPLAFAAQSASTAIPMLMLILAATLVCLAGGAPIWLRSNSAKPSSIPEGSRAVGVK